MLAPSRRWVVCFEVETQLDLVRSEANSTVSIRTSDCEIHLSALSPTDAADRPLLLAQVLIDAADPSAAEELAERQLDLAIDSLTYVTAMPIRVRRTLRVVEATSGEGRRLWVEHRPLGDPDAPIEGLRQSLVDSAAKIEAIDAQSGLRRALRWHASGIRARELDDQFQCFWFAIETLAQVHKSVEPVADTCARCRSPLVCQACNDVSTHRPYPKQAIRHLVGLLVKDDQASAMFETLSRVRNALLHGEGTRNIETSCGIRLVDAVEQLAKLTWHALHYSLSYHLDGAEIEVLRPNRVTHRWATVKFEMTWAAPDDGDVIEWSRSLPGDLTIDLIRSRRPARSPVGDAPQVPK